MNKPATPLNPLARDIMTPEPISVSTGTTVRELARILIENQISGVPVVDPQDRVVGVVSKTDLLQRCLDGPVDDADESFFVALAEGTDDRSSFELQELGTVEDFMSAGPVTVLPTDSVNEVARRMVEDRIHRVIVTDEEQHLLGIVTSLDLLMVFPEQRSEAA